MELSELTLGTRVRLVRDVSLYPHALLRAGLTGQVAELGDDNDPPFRAVRLDELVEGLDEWDNCVHVGPDHLATPDDFERS